MATLNTAQTAQTIINALGLDTDALFKLNVSHFSENEGINRDKIVKGYFGADGLDYLHTEIGKALQGKNKPSTTANTSLIDLATGTGTFLLPIMDQLKLHQAVALDATPKFLEIVQQKAHQADRKVQTVIGDLEQITLSLDLNQQHRNISIPSKFDRVMCTLALHHIPDTSAVLRGIADILLNQGIAVIVDMILDENPGSDWTPDPTHAHHGFQMSELANLAKQYFDEVSIRELSVKCIDASCDSRGSGIFILILEAPKQD